MYSFSKVLPIRYSNSFLKKNSLSKLKLSNQMLKLDKTVIIYILNLKIEDIIQIKHIILADLKILSFI